MGISNRKSDCSNLVCDDDVLVLTSSAPPSQISQRDKYRLSKGVGALQYYQIDSWLHFILSENFAETSRSIQDWWFHTESGTETYHLSLERFQNPNAKILRSNTFRSVRLEDE